MQASTYFPKVRRMLLFAPLIFTRFWPASTLLHGHIALAIPSLLETDPQILERWGLRWWGSPGQIIPKEGFWSRILKWRAIAFVNFTRWISFRMSELFRKIDFGGFMSWQTQPNCRVFNDRCWTSPCFNSWQVSRLTSGLLGLSWLLSQLTTGCNVLSCRSYFFNMATVLLSSFFLDLSVGLFINLTMCIRALVPKFATALGLVEQAFWRVPLFTEWLGASSFEVILAGPSRHSTTWDFFLLDFGFSTHYCHSAAWKNLETNSAVSFLHVYLYRDGNCNCLL